jgi:GR25 family glycosyltransferase involved in LPS biosynthesis
MTFIKINYLLIHCDEHKERETNIEKNKLTLNKEIQIFKGFYTKQNSILKDDIVAFLKKYDMNLKMEQLSFWRPGEIGCYLSHHMIIRDIMISLPKNQYTVIFEDDVTFKETLHEDIEKIINNFNNLDIEWDVIFLGNITSNHKIQVIDNIYTVDENNVCTGTHALLINNKNVEKIYKIICNIVHAIDFQYKINIDNKNLNGFTIYPPLCYQQNDIYVSNIQ